MEKNCDRVLVETLGSSNVETRRLCDLHRTLGSIDRVRKEWGLGQRTPKASEAPSRLPSTQKRRALHVQLEWSSWFSAEVPLTGPAVVPSSPVSVNANLHRTGFNPSLTLPLDVATQDVDFPMPLLGFLDEAFVVLTLVLLVEAR